MSKTYMVTFPGGNKVIFGSNYKPWYRHAAEYAAHRYPDSPKLTVARHVMMSSTPFVDDGGLKWCGAERYQEVIDDVAAKTGKKLKPFSDYKWQNVPTALARLDREIASL